MQNSKYDEASLNPFQLMLRSFASRTFRWVAPVVVIAALVFGSLALFCAWQMFNTPVMADKLHWAVGALATLLVMLVLRIWLLLEMHRLSLLRELKNLETQLSNIQHAIQSTPIAPENA